MIEVLLREDWHFDCSCVGQTPPWTALISSPPLCADSSSTTKRGNFRTYKQRLLDSIIAMELDGSGLGQEDYAQALFGLRAAVESVV